MNFPNNPQPPGLLVPKAGTPERGSEARTLSVRSGNAPAKGATGQAIAFNFPGLLSALRRRATLAFLLAISTAALVAPTVYLLWPVNYSARTLLQVSSARPKILYDTTTGMSEFASYQRFQLALVKSRLVLNTALREPKIAKLQTLNEQPDPLDWLEKNVVADFAVAPEILRITISGRYSQDLPKLVDAVREAFLKEIVEKDQTGRTDRLDKLRKLYDKYDDLLRDKRRKLRDMADTLGSRDAQVLTLKHKFALTQLNDLQMEYLKIQSQLRRAQLEISLFRNKEAASEDKTKQDEQRAELDRLIEFNIRKDPLVEKLTHEVKQLTDEVGRLKASLVRGEKDPAVVGRKRALEVAKTTLETRKKELHAELATLIQQKHDVGGAAAARETERQFALLQDMEKLVSKEVKERTQEVYVLFKGTVDLEWLRDEIAQTDDVTKALSKQIQALQVEMEAPARVTFLEEAIVSPPANRGLQMAGLAGFGSFALILFGVAFLEFRTERVNSASEVVQRLRLPLVGSLPLLPAKVRRNPSKARASSRYWHNLLTESIDATRNMLLHLSRLESLKVVMVTSAGGGEGKTMLSCHLAASLARAGKKVLLIDGDLRRPSVQRVFNLAPAPGLCEVLRGELPPGEAIHAGPTEGLWVLAGGGVADTLALCNLSLGAPGDILKTLREQFDFILIDSAPVLPVADTQLLCQHVDGVVLSILRDVTRLPFVQTAHDRLAMLGARIVGFVVTGASPGSYGSSYDYAPGR